MTFFVSDALKDRVTEDSLSDSVYHEEEEVNLVAAFYIKEDVFALHDIVSIEKANNKLDILLDITLDSKSIEYFLNNCHIDKFEIFVNNAINVITTLKNANIELVKIKKTNDRNSYFARIVIV